MQKNNFSVTCPNNKNHKEFVVSAKLSQAWVVDKRGNFKGADGCAPIVVEEIAEDSCFICKNCGAHANVKRFPEIVSFKWCVEDIQAVRPDLSKEKACQVLKQMVHFHDATIGINWDVIECTADMMFPKKEKKSR